MFLDNLTNRREPQTVTIGARRKKRLEDTFQHCFVHAAPGIGDRNGYEAAGTDPNTPNAQHVSNFPHSDLKLDDTWFVHRLCRIVADIQDDLLQLRGFRRYDCHFGCLAHRGPDMGR